MQMRKGLMLLGMFGLVFAMSGCGTEKGTEKLTDSASDIYEHPIVKMLNKSQDNLESYEYRGDVQFIPVSFQHVDDGTNGLDIIKYVDLNTGVMYVYTEKMQAGYGISWNVLLNSDGTPFIYENLQELREKYGWENSANVSGQ